VGVRQSARSGSGYPIRAWQRPLPCCSTKSCGGSWNHLDDLSGSDGPLGSTWFVEGTGQDSQPTTLPAPGGKKITAKPRGSLEAKTLLVLSNGKEATASALKDPSRNHPPTVKSNRPHSQKTNHTLNSPEITMQFLGGREIHSVGDGAHIVPHGHPGAIGHDAPVLQPLVPVLPLP